MARMVPPKGFKTTSAKKDTLPRLLKILFKNFKWQLLLVFLCLILATLSNLTSSLFVRTITDTIVVTIQNQTPFSEYSITFAKILVAMGSLYAVGLISSFLWNRNMAIITHKFLNILRKQVFDHMQTLPIKYFDTHAHGDIMSMYTNDIDTIRQLISQSMPAVIQTTSIILTLIVVMLTSSIYLTGLVIVGAVGMFFVTKFYGSNSSKYFIKQQRNLGIVEGEIEETIKGLKVIKVFTHEEESIKQFEKRNEELCQTATKANIYGNSLGPIMMNLGHIVYSCLVALGALLLMNNIPNLTITGFHAISYGVITQFLLMSRMFTNNVNNFAQQMTFIVMGLAGASRIFDLIDEKSEEDNGYVTLVHIKRNPDGTFEETDERTRDYAWKHPHKAEGTITYTELKGDITLNEVDFGYNPEKIVLHDVSIYARPGEKIAFVGSTGAGKTTITNLINRFYDIADGKIRYDGININKIKKADLRNSLGIVLQDTNLFTGTVMDNIRYGRLDATDEECIEAAKIANAYDFITRLPEGFNTMLDGDGSNLSQGQRQLISIARAAVKDAPVMILDEATSSIDTRTERLVELGTDKLMEGRTVFVIAHRLSTIQNADAIMVLEKGRIIERGNHEDLLALKGVYSQLYNGAFELE